MNNELKVIVLNELTEEQKKVKVEELKQKLKTIYE